jgi:hypothetical protein
MFHSLLLQLLAYKLSNLSLYLHQRRKYQHIIIILNILQISVYIHGTRWMTRTFTNNSPTSRRIAETHSKLGSRTNRFAKSVVRYFAWNFKSLPLITWIFVLGARWRLPGGAILFEFQCATARCLTENKITWEINSINSSAETSHSYVTKNLFTILNFFYNLRK